MAKGENSPSFDPDAMVADGPIEGVDAVTGYQGNFMGLVAPVVKEWSTELKATPLPPHDTRHDPDRDGWSMTPGQDTRDVA